MGDVGPTRRTQIQDIQAAFLAAQRQATARRIEQFLADVPESLRSEVLAALLPAELEQRRAQGAILSVDDYLIRFPADAPLVRQLFAEFERANPDGSTLSYAHDQVSSLPGKIPLRRSPVPAAGRQGVKSPGAAAESGRSVPPPARGRVFGDYELFEPPLGRGGMGVVYRAQQISLNRPVALKMIRDGELAESQEVQRFFAEAEAAGRLDHPRIVRVFQVGQADGRHFYSMALVEGQSLAQRVQSGPLPPREAAELVAKVADAVSYAHGQGIIHRDLKPGNILVDRNGDPLVTDFGLAKRINAGDGLTATGQVLGTPSYMPPEQASGQGVDARADVYSLGAVLYCLLTGRPPFQSDNQFDTIQQVLRDPPVAPRLLNPKVPRDLEQVCLKCLAKQPEDRFESAETLARDLERYLRGEPVMARPIGWLGRTWRWAKRNRGVAAWAATATAIACVALLVGGLAWHFARTADVNSREVAQRKALATRQASLDQLLRASQWTDDEVQALDELVTKIRELSQDEGTRAAQRIDDALTADVRQLLRAPSLADSDLRVRIEHRLELLTARAPDVGAKLRSDYRERLARPENVVHLSPTRGDPLVVFPGLEFRRAADGLARVPSDPESPDKLFFTAEAVRGDVTLEVEFGPGWDSGPSVGVALGEKGYRFLVQAAQPETTTIRADRESRGPLRVSIARGTQLLQLAELPSASTRDDRLHLVASRSGAKLRLVINQSKTVDVYDYFPLPASEQGRFGLQWPRAAPLRLLLASRQVEPPAASPMEQGDTLYSAEAYSEALVYYQQQANVLGDARAREEAEYKQGLCLAALRRHREAIEVLRPITEGPNPILSLAASCQLVGIMLQEQRNDEADQQVERLLIASLAKRPALGDDSIRLSALIPWEVRSAILGYYSQQGGTAYWRPDAQRIAKQERALALGEQLDDSMLGWTQLRLLRAYRYEGKEELALSAARRFLDQYLTDNTVGPDEAAFVQAITAELAWMLRVAGLGRVALDVVNRSLVGPDGQLRGNVLPLLLERARVYGQLEQWAEARRELEAFLDTPGVEQQFVGHLTEARLMLGFVRQKLGLDGVEESWKQAFDRPTQDSELRAPGFGGGIDLVNTLVAGSLGNAFTDAQIEAFATHSIAPHFGIDPIRFGLVTNLAALAGLRMTMLRDMWLSPRGREAALRWAFHQEPFGDHFRLPARVLAYHFIVESAFPEMPSAAQQQLVWETARRGLAALSAGQVVLSVPLLTSLALTWSGQDQSAGLLRAFEFDPVLRARAGYVLAERFRRLGQPDRAKSLLESALAAAPDDASLVPLIAAARTSLGHAP